VTGNLVAIFPNEAGVLRRAGSALIEVLNEWEVSERRHWSEGSMPKISESNNDENRKEAQRPAKKCSSACTQPKR
jgi:hypothetical protein